MIDGLGRVGSDLLIAARVLFAAFHLAGFTRPFCCLQSEGLAMTRFSLALLAYQQPLRLRLLGSGAPGCF